MQYRTLGKTGWQVSALGFGGSPLGGVFGAVEAQEGIRAVHVAADQGINYFDVAPFYGLTKAETALGNALHTLPRDSVYLSTKVGRYGQAEFDFSETKVVQSIEDSLRRLRTDYIDLIICHDIEFVSPDQIVEETLPALRRVQAQGKVRAVGVSGLPLAIFPAILDHAPLDIVLSYCHYALNDTSLETLLPYLAEKEVGVINAAPLGMGLLSGSAAPDWHPAPAALQEACARAAEHCRQQGVEIAQLALAFALQEPRIASTLVGMSSVAQVQQNLAWIQSPPDPTLLSEVQAILQPVHNLTWPSGRHT